MGKESEEQGQEEERDAFEALLEDEPAPDPELEESESEAAGEEEAAADDASERGAEAEDESEPEGEGEPAEGDEGGEEEEPEARPMGELEERLTGLERENYSLRRDLMKYKERDRISKEQERIRAIEEGEGEESPEIGSINEEGKVVLNREALEQQIARVQARRSAAPAADYESFRDRIAETYPEEQRDEVRAAADELAEGYQFLDQEIGKFCKEAEISPRQIGGMANTLTILEQTGIAREFKRKYPGVSMTNVMLAPNSETIARSEVDEHIRRRAKRKPAEEEGKETVEKPKVGAKPRPMSRRGRNRAPSRQTTLTQVDPAEIFDMPDDQFDDLARASEEALERA